MHLGMDRLLRDRGLGSLGFLSRRGREINRGLLGGGGSKVVAAQNLSDLSGVVSSILLADGSEMVGLLLSSISNLGSLGIDGIGSSLELLVDKLLVLGVDQGGQEGNGGSDDGKDPVGQHLDQEARDEGSDASSSRNADILNENNALGFNQEEVDESMGIANQPLKGVVRKCVVLAGAELRGQAIVKDQLACNLGSNSGSQNHPGQGENPAKEVEIPDGDNGRNDGNIGDGRVTRVLPGQKLGEERMVGRQGLSSAAVGGFGVAVYRAS